MSKIDDMIRTLCPKGVEHKKLAEITKSIKTGLNPRQNFKLNVPSAQNYYVTVKEITTGHIVFSEKTDRIDKDAWRVIQSRSALEMGDVLFSGIGTIGKTALVDIPVENWNVSESVFLIKPNQHVIIPKFLMYALGSCHVKKQYENQSVGSTLKGVRMATLSLLSIPVPPLPVQEEIVRILDSFTKLEAELEAELEARRQQYEFYRDKLLSFNELHIGQPGGVRLMALGKIADIGTGSSNTNEELPEGKYPFFVRSQDVRWKNSYEFDETAIITSGDGVGVGKVFHYVEGKYALHQRAYRIHIHDNSVVPKYLFHYIKTYFYQYITKNAFHSSVTSVRRPMLVNFPVPIPPLSEQERIVSILDKFDALVNDLTSGLPAELAARRQQYEYYRDRLLSFNPISQGA